MKNVTISTCEVLQKFPDESSARIYLEKIKWNDQPFCPYCEENIRIKKRSIEGYYRCSACSKDFTVRSGTIMERSHIPLNKWLYAMYLLVTARKGISSLQLSKELGITQKSAWFLLQRLREACKGDGEILMGVESLIKGMIGKKLTYAQLIQSAD